MLIRLGLSGAVRAYPLSQICCATLSSIFVKMHISFYGTRKSPYENLESLQYPTYAYFSS